LARRHQQSHAARTAALSRSSRGQGLARIHSALPSPTATKPTVALPARAAAPVGTTARAAPSRLRRKAL